MTRYGLRRGNGWVCAPARVPAKADRALFIRGLTLGQRQDRAWTCDSLTLAHERQGLLRLVLGWSTEIRALRPQQDGDDDEA